MSKADELENTSLFNSENGIEIVAKMRNKVIWVSLGGPVYCMIMQRVTRYESHSNKHVM